MRRGWGLLSRRERWGLSLPGWLLLLFVLGGAVVASAWNAYSFLTITDRAPDAHVMVVEGWVPSFVIRQAVREYATGHYSQIYTTGGPISGDGGYTNDYNTSASVGMEQLRRAGLDENVIRMVPSRVSSRDRTYASAIALREWFRAQHEAIGSFDVITENTHARRSQLLFQKAFGKNVRVGVIGVDNPDYSGNQWWESSEGVKDVVTEGLGYVYSKLFFRSPE